LTIFYLLLIIIFLRGSSRLRGESISAFISVNLRFKKMNIDYFFVIFVPFVVNTLFEKTKPILAKNKRKKAKMRVNPAGFLEKQGDISEKRRKFELNLKKQTQFYRSGNERKVIYDKGIREIYAIGHLVKTNPIQSQTKPIKSRKQGQKLFLGG